jgi:hypothetical protein
MGYGASRLLACRYKDQQMDGARTHRRNGLPVVIGAKIRMGRVRVAVRRCFIASNGQPILVRDVLERCYPRVKRFRSRQYDLARQALRRVAVIVVRNRHGRGRPALWARRDKDAT